MGKFKHGHSYRGFNTREYTSWVEIKRRCFNDKCKCFKNYGGRGITMSKDWSESFLNFYRDMGKRPHGKQIDRINNDGNYEKGNCRWSSHSENQLNKRNNNLITAFGKTKSISSWAKEFNLSYLVIYKRLKRGWTPERAISAKRLSNKSN